MLQLYKYQTILIFTAFQTEIIRMHMIVFLSKKMHISNFRALPRVPLRVYTRDGVCLSLKMPAAHYV